MKYLKIASMLLAGSVVTPASADVFISEYIEGSSNNKAVELYNSGAESVDLSGYVLQIYSNGNTVANGNINLSGNIAPGGTYIIANGSSDPAILAVTDLIGNVSFNGDDAVVLSNNGLLLDVIGQIGTDPGSSWNVGGVKTQNETLERVASVLSGEPNGDDAFDPSAEWIAKGNDNFSGLTVRTGEAGGDPVDPIEPPSDGDIIAPCLNCPDLSAVADPDTFDANVFYADVNAAITALPAEPSAAQLQAIKALLADKAKANHVVLSYSQVWSALTATDEDPANTDNVILIYSGRSIAKFSNGSGDGPSSNPDNWNREHSWPKSHGFPSTSQDAYSDIHHLRPSDISVNSTRGNLDFDFSDNSIGEAPGNFVDGDSFEPRNEVKGDIARMMMYMDTRYDGATGEDTPDLVLLDRFTTTGEAALGKLCVLLNWHAGDPVDDTEINRHNKIYQYQGNRNPYVDKPELVDVVYPLDACSSVVDPVDPIDPIDPEPIDPEPIDPVDPTPGTPSNSPLVLTAVFDGDLSGGLPKGVEIYVSQNIADLSICGIGSANNGGGSDGQEFTFPAQAASVGDFIYVASEETGFNTYFNFFPDFTSGAMSINGDDAVELYCNGEVVDLYGAVDVNGDNETWDYTDSFAKRVSNTSPSAGFVESNWIFAGRSALDGSSTGEAVTLGTFELAQGELFISEYVEGSGSNKVIELANLTGREIDLSEYSIVGFQNGNVTVGYTIELEGTLADQAVYVIANSSADAEVAALADQFGSLFFNGDDAVVLFKGEEVIDVIGQVGVDPGSEWGTGLISTRDNTIRRLPGITAGDTNPDDAFDPSIEWEGFAQNTFDNIGIYGSDDGIDIPSLTLGQCYAPATLMSEVQGNGDTTPLNGEEVIVEGVVTLIGEEQFSGFFIQEEDFDHDADPSTSEGLFVFTGGTPSNFAVGDVIRVKGIAGEFNDKTQLSANEISQVCGQNVVSASGFDLPVSSLADFEALENMVVSNESDLFITGTFNYIRFGEVVVSSERLFTPTHLYSPDSAEAIALADKNQRNQIILDDLANGSFNPVDTFGELSPGNSLRTGSMVLSSTFVMDYGFNSYRLRPISAVSFTSAPRPAAPVVNGNVKVASFNVLNLFNGDGMGEGFPTARGADTLTEYDLQLDKIVQAISALDASVVGLMEIENDGYDANSSIAQLVDALNVYNGSDIYSFVDPGAVQGTDAISVGLIYRNDQVSLVDGLKVLSADNSIADEDGPLFDTNRNRPSFAQKFETTDTERTFVVNVNHFKSKGSSCGSDDDSVNGQGNCNLTRTRAAQAVQVWLATQFSDEPILIVGDLNAYAKEDPITTLSNAGYTDIARDIHGPMAYSYTFSNEFGSLDYILGNAAAMDAVVGIEEWHINADEQAIFDYNETIGFGSDIKPSNFVDTSEYRSSDHDPVVVGLQLDSLLIPGDVDGNGVVNFVDYFRLFLSIGKVEGQFGYFAAADLDNDGSVTRTDASIWLANYFTPPPFLSVFRSFR